MGLNTLEPMPRRLVRSAGEWIHSPHMLPAPDTLTYTLINCESH